jgi:hypothetical protein
MRTVPMPLPVFAEMLEARAIHPLWSAFVDKLQHDDMVTLEYGGLVLSFPAGKLIREMAGLKPVEHDPQTHQGGNI